MLLRFRGSRTDYKPVALCTGVAAEVGERLVTLGFPKEQDLSIIDGLLSNKAQNALADERAVHLRLQRRAGVRGGRRAAAGPGPGRDRADESVNFFTPIHRATSLLQDGGIKDVPRCGAPTQGNASSSGSAPSTGVNASGGSIAVGGKVTGGSSLEVNN